MCLAELPVEHVNLYAAWIGILAGFVAGAIQGSFFHNEQWLGGYASWPRRLTRLGHVSFFGLAGINFAYALSLPALGVEQPSVLVSTLFVVGAITMPLVCYLSAWRKPLRHLFPIPVVSLIGGASLFLWLRWTS
jgi:hypothetical protein